MDGNDQTTRSSCGRVQAWMFPTCDWFFRITNSDYQNFTFRSFCRLNHKYLLSQGRRLNYFRMDFPLKAIAYYREFVSPKLLYHNLSKRSEQHTVLVLFIKLVLGFFLRFEEKQVCVFKNISRHWIWPYKKTLIETNIKRPPVFLTIYNNFQNVPFF